MISFKHYTEKHDHESEIRFKDLLPKKLKHAINRLLHKDKYKAAIKLKHSIQRKYPDYSEAKVLRLVSDFTHIKLKELKAILNRKTRHE
jgi:NADH:ubiquinone oxidoreductase subunit E